MLIEKLYEIDEDPNWTYMIKEGVYMPVNMQGNRLREPFPDLILLYDISGTAIELKSTKKHKKHAIQQIYNGEKFIRDRGYYYTGGKFVTYKDGFKYEKIKSYRHFYQADSFK